jgi:hypothetical protein
MKTINQQIYESMTLSDLITKLNPPELEKRSLKLRLSYKILLTKITHLNNRYSTGALRIIK